MLGFGRRRPGRVDDDTAERHGGAQRAAVMPHAATPLPGPSGFPGGITGHTVNDAGVPGTYGQPGVTTGWAPYGHGQAPTQQIGAFAGTLLNQFPALVPGVQLHSGREGNNSGWYTPTRTVIPNGTTIITQQEARPLGAQRSGSRYTGPLGPVNVKAMQARVAAAQVRQSGLSGFPWAAGLTPSE